LPAAALAADEPLVPVGDGQLGTVARCHRGGIGLDLVLAIAAPHNEADARRAVLGVVRVGIWREAETAPGKRIYGEFDQLPI
jgi:hypothetical protein